jgi:hypothetical protein
MNILKQSILIIFLATPWSLFAATSVQGPNGDNYTFGDWSPAKPINVKSSGGEIALVKRTCILEIEHRKALEKLAVDLVYEPDGREIYIGQQADIYALVGNKIWGLSADGRWLWIHCSDTADNKDNTEEAIIAGVLARFINQQDLRLNGGSSSKTVDLCRAFGFGTIFPQVERWRPLATIIVNHTVDANGITLSLKSINDDNLALTINPNYEILNATKGGRAVYIVTKCVGSPMQSDLGIIPNKTAIPSDKGPLTILKSIWHYEQISKPDGTILGAAAVVSADNGDLWMGPIDCMVVAVGGKLIGVKSDDDRQELLVYAGPRSRIPLGSSGVAVFRAEEQRLSDELKANNYQFRPDLRISIPGLLAGDNRFAADCSYSLGKVTVRENKAMVQINGQPLAYPEISISADLNVRVNRVIPTGSPELSRP